MSIFRWTAVLFIISVATAPAHATPLLRSSRKPSSPKRQRRRSLSLSVPPQDVWGIQSSGPRNGHYFLDAGGMIYDEQRNELVLVGTTYDNQFLVDEEADTVDCFILTLPLDGATTNNNDTDTSAAVAKTTMGEEDPGNWEFSDQYRVTTLGTLDRCDLMAQQKMMMNDRIFTAGTVATATNEQMNKARAVLPFFMEVRLSGTTIPDAETTPTTADSASSANTSTSSTTQVETGPPWILFEPEKPMGALILPRRNEIIIPSAMTTHQQIDGDDNVVEELYIATIHRIIVVTESSNDPQLYHRLDLGITKFNSSGADESLTEEWSRTYRTSILEIRSDGVPPVISGMFLEVPGAPAAEEEHLDSEIIEEEINELEDENEPLEPSDVYRHEYRYDGVLITGLEVIPTPPDAEEETYLLIAGSAPGIDPNNAFDHPFLDSSPTTIAGDWDGYIAKISSATGEVMGPLGDDDYNWSYRFDSQPGKNDFIQSICVPRLPPRGESSNNDHDIVDPLYPSVVYAIGTTEGIHTAGSGDPSDGGAVFFKLDLSTMDVIWKRQLFGTHVHGLSCQVLVDAAAHELGLPPAESEDLLYVAGEVNGNMTVELENGSVVVTEGHGETDIWVAQVNAYDGKIKWIQQVGTPQQDRLAKNINNPELVVGQQETDNIGETGSSKGAMILDQHGNAIVYGTTTGSLAREKEVGDQNRDIFVLRLHKDNGSFQGIMPSSGSVNTGTSVSSSKVVPSP